MCIAGSQSGSRCVIIVLTTNLFCEDGEDMRLEQAHARLVLAVPLVQMLRNLNVVVGQGAAHAIHGTIPGGAHLYTHTEREKLPMEKEREREFRKSVLQTLMVSQR
jgi:hypothetical protein